MYADCRQEGREGGRAGERERGHMKKKGWENLKRYRGRTVRHCNGWIEGKTGGEGRAGREGKGMEQELTEEGHTDKVCEHCLSLQN